MSMRLGKILVAVAGVLLMGGLIAACGWGEEGASPAEERAGQGAATVNVVMVETREKWGFTLDRAEVPAGKVTLEVTNDGKFTHELMIFPPQDLSPLLEEMVQAAWSGEASGGDEPAGLDDGGGDGGGDVEHETTIEGLVTDLDGEGELVLEPDESASITVELTPGTYELGCLIVETVGEETFNHYDKGMRATLTVE